MRKSVHETWENRSLEEEEQNLGGRIFYWKTMTFAAKFKSRGMENYSLWVSISWRVERDPHLLLCFHMLFSVVDLYVFWKMFMWNLSCLL